MFSYSLYTVISTVFQGSKCNYVLPLPSLISIFKYSKETYGLKGKNIYEVLSSSSVHSRHGPDAPSCLTHRYITEDVPYL